MHFFLFLFSLLFSISVQAEETTGRDALLRLLPSVSQLPGWELDYTPQTAEGTELFQLINGGAEIYIQEGFKRAVLASYTNKKGNMINLEIFEMTSAESARNTFIKKIGKQGKKLLIGEDAILEDYYLNFRKGCFQVTLSLYAPEEESMKMLIEMARMVAGRIYSLQWD